MTTTEINIGSILIQNNALGSQTSIYQKNYIKRSFDSLRFLSPVLLKKMFLQHVYKGILG